MKKIDIIALLTAFLSLGVGGASSYTGHPDGNWLIALGLLVIVIMGLTGRGYE